MKTNTSKTKQAEGKKKFKKRHKKHIQIQRPTH